MLIDTLKAQRRLTESGFDEKQAEPSSPHLSLVELLATTDEQVATKEDLTQGIDLLRHDLEHQIDDLRQDMVRRFEIVYKRFEVLQRDLTIRI